MNLAPLAPIMGDGASVHVRAAGGGGISITRKGSIWLAKLNEAAGFLQESGVPVTVSGLRQALQGMSAYFVGLTHGLAFHWRGGELHADYAPTEGATTSLVIDRISLQHALEMMER